MVELNEVYVQKVKFQKLKKAIDINEVDIDCVFVLQKYSFKKNIFKYCTGSVIHSS